MSRYVANKDFNRFIRLLVKEGWVFSLNNHGRVTHPSGRYVTFSASPSDQHAFKNFRTDVRKLLAQIEKETTT
jgi:predicted RNA binding protein YcfA (HicA-like mRNA interferase family)